MKGTKPMSWISLLFLTALFYGSYNILIKLSSETLHPIGGAVMLQIGAAIITLAAVIILKLSGGTIPWNTQGMRCALFAGLFVAGAELSSFWLFSRGIQASIGIPLIIGGSVVAGVLLSVFFRKHRNARCPGCRPYSAGYSVFVRTSLRLNIQSAHREGCLTAISGYMEKE